MKKLNLEKSVAFVANIGVIAGIVFLALELRQNTDALQAQTRSSITDNNVTYLGWVARTVYTTRVRGAQEYLDKPNVRDSRQSLLAGSLGGDRRSLLSDVQGRN